MEEEKEEGPPVPSLAREAGQAVRWNAAAGAATLLSQLLQIVFLARWLSPAEFGLAAAALAVSGFLQGFADLGLTNALVQRPAVPRDAWSAAWWAALAGGSALALLMAASAGSIAGLLRLPGLAPLLLFAALALPTFGPAAVFQAQLQRDLRFRRLAVAEIAAALAALAAVLGWAHAHRGPAALVLGLVVLAGSRFLALGLFSTVRPGFRPRWAELRPLSAFGGFQMAERTLSYAAGNLDRLLVARLLGSAATGYYAMASQIALRPAVLLGPFVARTLLPLLARLQGERGRLASSYLLSLSLLAFVSAVIYALLFGLSEPLLALALGPGWGPAVPALRILAVLGFLVVLGNALGNLTLALGHAGLGFWLNAALLALRVAGICAGAHYGLQGVAAGMLGAMVLLLPLDFALPKRWLGIAPGVLFRAVAWPVIPGLLTATALAAVARRLTLAPWAEVALLGAAGLLSFTAAALALHRRRLGEAAAEIIAKLR